MHTVDGKTINEIIINKSRFIGYLVKVNNVDEVADEIKVIKKIYKDANHYCFAYIIDDIKKSSDDGEPGGTAGVPIMEVLLKNNLNYVLCVIVRYFGGIKLGAGGLVRAYSKASSEVIKRAVLREIIKGFKIVFSIKHEGALKLNNIIKNCKYECIYSENISYTIYCDKEIFDILNDIYDIDYYEEAIIIKN